MTASRGTPSADASADEADRTHVATSTTVMRVCILFGLFGVVYAAFVLAPEGQRLDAGSFRMLSSLSGPFGAAASVFRQAMPFVLAAVVLILGVIALLRGRWRDTVSSAALVAAALLVAEGLKFLLPRPGVGDVVGIVGNSYPSGHVAVALALALVTVILSPSDGWHIWLAWGSGTVVIGVAVCSVLSEAHRPSDVIGSALLVGCVVQAVFWRRVAMVDSRPVLARTFVCCAGLGAVLVAAAAALAGSGERAGSLAAGIPGWLLLCAAPAAYAVMLAPTGPLVPALRRGPSARS